MNFHRNEEKDIRLMHHRGIGFDDIVFAIAEGNLLAEELHDNQEKYPGRYLYYVKIDTYVRRVPFVRQENGDVFLKTAVPSRVATKRFIG